MGWMQHQTGPNYADNYEGMRLARAAASLAAVVDECPAAVWARDGWLAVSTVAPDCDEDDMREADGWAIVHVSDEDGFTVDYLDKGRRDHE